MHTCTVYFIGISSYSDSERDTGSEGRERYKEKYIRDSSMYAYKSVTNRNSKYLKVLVGFREQWLEFTFFFITPVPVFSQGNLLFFHHDPYSAKATLNTIKRASTVMGLRVNKFVVKHSSIGK